MEIINVKVGSPSQVKAEIKNITITGGSSKAVLYYPQELTSEQKQQARANIDAASQKDLQDGVNEALKEAKESGDFNGKDATVKIGPLSDLKELPELKIYQVTQDEYNDSYEAGTLDPNAVYVTPDSEYLTEETDPTVPAWAKAPTKPSYTASEVGADPSGTAETKVSAHNTSTNAHNDIRLLIAEITTKLTNFLDVDDTTVDQLSEVLTLINNNKGTLESLTTSKINVSAIVDNLTTSDSTKVLSAKQGVAIKSLIDALQIAVDNIKVPTQLSELTADATHRTVTDAEKETWNGKSNFDGNYNNLSNKPTIPSTTETWTFTLEDGSTVNKVVYVG